MKRVFDEKEWCDGIEWMKDPPDDWMALGETLGVDLFFWLEGYRVDDGSWDCCACIEMESATFHDVEVLYEFKAGDIDEARRLLDVAGDAFYEKEE